MNYQSIKKNITEILVVIAVLLGIRVSFYGLSRIPSESMVPTVLIGDFLAVANYPYGFTLLSIPYSPASWAGRLWAQEPERGDVIVIRVAQDQNRDYIKRLIGLPGDRIQMVDGVLKINGKKCPISFIKQGFFIDSKGKKIKGDIYKETLPNGKKHKILKVFPFGYAPHDNTKEFIVPQGEYFLMGDNRDMSQDSRTTVVRTIPKKYLIGRADIIWFSTNARSLFDISRWFSWNLLKKRFLKKIH